MGHAIALFVVGYVLTSILVTPTETYTGTSVKEEPQEPAAPIRWYLIGIAVVAECLVVVAVSLLK